MVIDLQQLAAWVGAFGVIAGVFVTAYKLIDKHLLKRLAAIEKRLKDVENWTGKQQQDISDSMERDKIIINGLLACLYGLHEHECNGAVTEAIKEINDYISKKAYSTFSKQKRDKN